MLNLDAKLKKINLDLNIAFYNINGFSCDEDKVLPLITDPVDKSTIKVAWMPAILTFKLSDSNVSVYRISTVSTFTTLSGVLTLSGSKLIGTINTEGTYYVDCRKTGVSFGDYYTYTVEIADVSQIEYIDSVSLVPSGIYKNNDGQHVSLNVVRRQVINTTVNYFDSIVVKVYSDPNYLNLLRSVTVPWASTEPVDFYIDPSNQVFFVTIYAKGLVDGTFKQTALTKTSFNIAP